MTYYWTAALAPTTRKTYSSGYESYLEFCTLSGLFPTPPIFRVPSEDILMQFASYLAFHKRLKYSTVKLYLAAVRHACLALSPHDPFIDMTGSRLPRLSLILRGIKRSDGPSNRTRRPIDLPILHDICNYVKTHLPFGIYDSYMLLVAFTFAFWGLLRCGEFTCRGLGNFDPLFDLTVNAVAWLDKGESFALSLKRSKTDVFRKGVSILYTRLKEPVCPVSALNRFSDVRGPTLPLDPLLKCANGHVLTRDVFIKKLRHVLQALKYDESHYNGHSFRKGGASTAALAKVEDHMIQTLGRWSSDCYIRYINVEKPSIKIAHQAMYNTL